ncbi:hypothetical protein, conserved [Trypanosoma cruzi]|uniref:Uncharacterized protein n=1 Tax=Trypanosoma cruzi (strain CL Brener) TaxID=353153 RepID=Q4DMI9_TRYCC|nr:hypothetical protein, conserved [Trypanosoma cruzi]EAN93752.1 hypothetical protein, conserved [Trypanosoma cruzi]|eukprot:XP_815603.1 hypothetical protein [Trypanosoma cruzi strain CL Brener]
MFPLSTFFFFPKIICASFFLTIFFSPPLLLLRCASRLQVLLARCRMGIFLGTLFFVAVGSLGALSAPLWAKSQVELVRILCFTAAFCCWLSWVLIYMAQMNPLLVPTRNIKKE